MAQGDLDRGLNQLRTLYANAPDSASLALSMARGTNRGSNRPCDGFVRTSFSEGSIKILID